MTELVLTPESECPQCKRKIDAAGNDEGSEPQEDDISICLYCQAILRFNEDLTLRTMTEEEWDELPYFVQAQITVERLKCKFAMKRTSAYLN